MKRGRGEETVTKWVSQAISRILFLKPSWCPTGRGGSGNPTGRDFTIHGAVHGLILVPTIVSVPMDLGAFGDGWWAPEAVAWQGPQEPV